MRLPYIESLTLAASLVDVYLTADADRVKKPKLPKKRLLKKFTH
jgi:hypothetical protein